MSNGVTQSATSDPTHPFKAKTAGSSFTYVHTYSPDQLRIERWYVIYTRARHEKSVAEQCTQRGVAVFLPLYCVQHRWKQRRAEVLLPLFPSYVFVRIALQDRLRVLGVPG